MQTRSFCTILLQHIHTNTHTFFVAYTHTHTHKYTHTHTHTYTHKHIHTHTHKHTHTHMTNRVESVYGFGLVAEHMVQNGLLHGLEVKDLNTPHLSLGLGEACYDAVICNFVPYLADPAQVVGEARKCVKDDGVVAISWSSKPRHQTHMSPAWRAATG